MPLLLRETLVLGLGVVVAALADIVFRLCGNRLELLPGIVVPICFCLVRLVFFPGCSANAGAIWQAVYQLMRAFGLIMLLLFEMGVGLFLGAKDIPGFVWGIIGGFGVAYVASVYIAESIQTSVEIRSIGPSDSVQRP